MPYPYHILLIYVIQSIEAAAKPIRVLELAQLLQRFYDKRIALSSKNLSKNLNIVKPQLKCPPEKERTVFCLPTADLPARIGFKQG
jgi:hypothetical protein